ncbi:hypothetical protein HOD19_01400 [bacterium]|jgi:hypothetical protein|nr:hypothetical protein [bacterium]MBT4649246.1 hypothetical protein [bacterium]
MKFFENFRQKHSPDTDGGGGDKVEQEENSVEKVEINSTASFQEALASSDLETAESWIDKIKTERPENYDDRWIDHRERELFKAYYGQEDWAAAKRIVEGSIKPDSKEGRKNRLADLAGQNYDEI